MNERTDDLITTLKSLRATRRKLRDIEDSTLDKLEPASQNEWAQSLQKVSLAITQLETAQLRTLSEKFKKQEPLLAEAAGRLEADLSELHDAVQVIQVISEGLKTITKIIRLLK
ncbi:MAG: hypothetical protein PVH77_08655 [Phycisphaerales bacterium]|jgi:hypothetical protein